MIKYIFISGIPASGKTTLGAEISSALGFPFLDKDEILEAMYDSLGTGDAKWRETLSRSADTILQRLVAKQDKAVFTSWWCHPKSPDNSGTQIDWINNLKGEIIEVHCICDPKEAAKRFQSRVRHQGHLDSTRGKNNLIPKFEQYSQLGPLSISDVIEVDTTRNINYDQLLQILRQNMEKYF